MWGGLSSLPTFAALGKAGWKACPTRSVPGNEIKSQSVLFTKKKLLF
jgi:hypothetical protein